MRPKKMISRTEYEQIARELLGDPQESYEELVRKIAAALAEAEHHGWDAGYKKGAQDAIALANDERSPDHQ